MAFTILFTEKILSHTMKYFQFKTITKIKLVDYINDGNYPYVSFVFSEKMPYFPINLVKHLTNSTYLMETYNLAKITKSNLNNIILS